MVFGSYTSINTYRIVEYGVVVQVTKCVRKFMLVLGMYHVLVVFWSGALPDFSCECTGFNYMLLKIHDQYNFLKFTEAMP